MPTRAEHHHPMGDQQPAAVGLFAALLDPLVHIPTSSPPDTDFGLPEGDVLL